MPTPGFFPAEEPWTELPRLTPSALVDILCVAFLVYQVLVIIRGRRAAQILLGFGVIGLVYAAAVYLRLELLRTVLAALAPYTPFALIVVFQAEIRRMLARLGRSRLTGFPELERRETTEEILLAVGQLSSQRIGALIVIERNTGLRTFIESGVSIDGRVSRDLLCSIFHPGAALHDGAVIIQGPRVAAAACFLPLSTDPARAHELGTRHRAAIGVTEDSDALALVVSEETGRISVAERGEIERDVTAARVEEFLNGRASIKLPPEHSAPPLLRESGSQTSLQP
jgi:diadenylate cyclase